MSLNDLRQLPAALGKELRGNILPWWLHHGPDPEYGGFRGHISHDNRAVKGAGKGAVMHARILWTFSAAYRMFGAAEYRDMAREAFTVMRDFFMDRERGGVFWELDQRGTVKSDRKQVYALAFALYGFTEYHVASGDTEALDLSKELYHVIEEHALDRKRNGYLEAFSGNWDRLDDQRLSDKDQNESKTLNTHLHLLEAYTSLFRVWKCMETEQSLENLISLFFDTFISRDTGHLNLFFDDNWKLRSDFISFGHDIECSWLLVEAAATLGKRERIQKAGEMALRMAGECLQGQDSDGGLYYESFPAEGRVDTDKHWWPQAEALVGFCNAWQLSGSEAYSGAVLRTWDFIAGNLVNRTHGEWFWSTDRQGRPHTGREKAGFWKGPYHNGRACMELIRRLGTE